jgi:uncharacterized protein with PQ loop repeat
MTSVIKKCQGFCPPTIIYLVLSIVTTFVSLMTSHQYDNIQNNGVNKVLYTIIHLCGVGLWTWLLYWLCSNCYNTTAWVILLLPVIIFVILLILLVTIGFFAAASNDRRQYTQQNMQQNMQQYM